MRTSFHHQPEAQHPKFFSYPQAAGRLPHLSGESGRDADIAKLTRLTQSGHCQTETYE